MRKIISSLLFTIIATAANAQYRPALVQDFNISCLSPSVFPSDSDWVNYTPVTGAITNGEWQCTGSNGRWGTPGIECTGVWGTPPSYNLDTSYLISPPLDLHSYLTSNNDSIYLEFDTKTTGIVLGGRLAFTYCKDSTFATDTFFDLTSAMSPVFSNSDSSDWVTHQVSLAAFALNVPLYLAFRYTSTTSSGSTWYLDNIHITIFPLRASNLTKNTLPLTVIGNSTSSQIIVSYKTESPGMYDLAIYDIIGHKVYEENLSAQKGNANYTITGLNLHSGIYLIKMGNGLTYGTAKTIVQ